MDGRVKELYEDSNREHHYKADDTEFKVKAEFVGIMMLLVRSQRNERRFEQTNQFFTNIRLIVENMERLYDMTDTILLSLVQNWEDILMRVDMERVTPIK